MAVFAADGFLGAVFFTGCAGLETFLAGAFLTGALVAVLDGAFFLAVDGFLAVGFPDWVPFLFASSALTNLPFSLGLVAAVFFDATWRFLLAASGDLAVRYVTGWPEGASIPGMSYLPGLTIHGRAW